ncbi:hypothetical protein CEXT_257781 [Caerostris extrusa]|uniref:Uncharacterized protein n=1 Tax=Caerostris extrusa TaxID=172846 RepID=A0AAV4XL75_CAEEX|nr:hypothetical protein CEXT_257781 [Caerostris extrusa]
MVEAGRECRMCKFSGKRCYPQCEDAGSIENVGSRRVRQIISKQSTDGGSRQRMSNVQIFWEAMLSPMKQWRTLASEEFGISFQSNRLMVESGRVCRMFKFSGKRCYPQCEDAGSSGERWQQKVRQIISKQSTDCGSRQRIGRNFG